MKYDMAVLTSNSPQEYDRGVLKTIPYYENIHAETIDLIAHVVSQPVHWVDTGCGTGRLVIDAVHQFLKTRFTLADPSEEMLKMAKIALAGTKNCTYVQAGTESLPLPDQSTDVITAILAHHYLDAAGRAKVIRNCFRILRPGGVLVSCEHTAPRTEYGFKIAAARWKDWQIRAGKPADAATSYIARYGSAFFPIKASEHFSLLEKCGFSLAEILYASYCDIVFYAIKPS